MQPVDLDPAVRANVLAWGGAGGRRWLDALPLLAERLAREWQVELGPPYGGGTHSLVVPATRPDSLRAVLKIPMVDDENRHEAAALRLYAGQGAALLFDFDPASGAMLLERLVPGTPLRAHPDRSEAIDIVCEVLGRLRRVPPPGHPFRLVTDQAAAWARKLAARRSELADGDLRRLADEARDLASELSRDPGPVVLVNRDAHRLNVLAAEREPWLLIDPKPLVGDPAFDAGYLLGDLIEGDWTPANAAYLIDTLAAGLRVDAGRVRAWALIRAMENAMWYMLDQHRDAHDDIAIARAVAAVRP